MPMSAGGFANTLRRTLAVVLTLLTLAVGVLWGDSYRGREPMASPYAWRSADDSISKTRFSIGGGLVGVINGIKTGICHRHPQVGGLRCVSGQHVYRGGHRDPQRSEAARCIHLDRWIRIGAHLLGHKRRSVALEQVRSSEPIHWIGSQSPFGPSSSGPPHIRYSSLFATRCS